MIKILILFCTGILSGYLLRSVKSFHKKLSKMSFILVVILLFLLGYQAGNNPAVSQNMGTIGINALIIAILSITGSILFVKILSKLFENQNKNH